jgi:hypothetical protein
MKDFRDLRRLTWLFAALLFIPVHARAQGQAPVRAVEYCGGADDQTALTRLLGRPGAVVSIPSGCTATVTALKITQSGVTIDCGAGAIIKLAGAGSLPILAVEWVNGFTIRGCTFDGNAQVNPQARMAVAVSNSRGVHFDNVRIQNVSTLAPGHGESGFEVYNSQGDWTGGSVENVGGGCMTIRDSPAAANASYMFSISGADIGNCANGIYIEGFHTDVWNNKIHDIVDPYKGSGQAGNGVFAYKSTGINVSGNRIVRTQYSGIRTNSSADVVVSGNNVMFAGDWCIYNEFGAGTLAGKVAITGNECGNLQGGGIVSSNADDEHLNWAVTISGNTISNCAGSGTNGGPTPVFGVGIVVEKFTNVVGNTVDGCYLGIAMGSMGRKDAGQGAIAQNNLIMDSRPVTVNLAGASGTAKANDECYVGTSWETATKRCKIVSDGSGTVVVRMTQGFLSPSDAIRDVEQSNWPGSGRILSVVGPTLQQIALNNVAANNKAPFNLNDYVYVGASPEKAATHGFITRVSASPCGSGCTATVLVTPSLSGVFPDTEALLTPGATLKNLYNGATATTGNPVNTRVNMQVGIGLDKNSSGAFCQMFLTNNRVYGAELKPYAGTSNADGKFYPLSSSVCATHPDNFQQPVPSGTAFGTNPVLAPTSTDTGGVIEAGSGPGRGTGTLTFAVPYTAAAPACFAVAQNTAAANPIMVSASTTAITFTPAAPPGAGSRISYWCTGGN